MHHVELLWDEDTDRAVRAQWDLLAAADLPSQARHRSRSNAPHTSLSVLRRWPAEQPAASALDQALDQALAALPLAATLGALTCFGRGPFVLVRPVVVTAALLRLHAQVHAVLGEPAQAFLAPGAWVPHVTLAHRLDAGQVARALGLLAQETATAGFVVGARHWDSEARTLTRLAGPPRAATGEQEGPAGDGAADVRGEPGVGSDD